MGIMAGNEQEKLQLAADICDLSARAIFCANFHQSHSKKLPFINWYLVLRVNENADIYGIRKQYHKLALQLHPDKNKHSKAETAFKLVSEAYFCLSDSTRRSAFDSEKQTISCTKCNTTSHTPTSRLSRIHKRMKELRTKLKDEANIIERCLIANAKTTAASRTQLVKNVNGTKTELPVFNPSDYYQYKGSPQNRTINHNNLEDLRAGFMMRNRCINDRVMNSSPVFQYRSERSSFMSTCASTRDR